MHDDRACVQQGRGRRHRRIARRRGEVERCGHRIFGAFAGTLLLAAAAAWAQPPPGRASPPVPAPAAPPAPPSARAQAPFDPTGYWVSIVTQDWRFRMVVPGPGEYDGIPITLKSKQFADAWKAAPDEAAGKQCEAYGAAAIMRVPERLHLSWRDPDTLLVQTDSGMQTRVLHFKPSSEDAAAAPSWQGYSLAQWRLPPAPPGTPRGPAYGTLQITTTHLLPGLLRKNGVPYSGATQLTEYWEVHAEPAGEQWLTVTTRVEDPEYLRAAYIVNSIFEREADGSKWSPEPCALRE